jgi:outer membrane lipoprotein-sorting protein
VKSFRSILPVLFCLSICASAQTADEIIAKNIAARGGMDKLKAVNTLRTEVSFSQGPFRATVVQENKRPDMMRTNFLIQGMTQITSYDGSTGWQVSPFQGRKDPELLGEDELKPLVESADFDGPLVDYKSKGNTVEYLGHDEVDGDDAYKLKATLKNGDIFYYYYDPDTYMEIQRESQTFVRGAMRELVSQFGSYKAVNGVMYPFSVETWPKSNPSSKTKITVQKLETNLPIPDSEFKMPATPQANTPPEKPKSN